MTTTTHGVGPVTILATASEDDWKRHARCGPRYTDLPAETWFSEDPTDIAAAIAVCRTCPFRAKCAMERTTIGEFTSGVWGGVYFPEHRDPVRRDICGSHAGALAHKRAHERNCIECRDVENMRENLRKSARRQCRIAGCDNLCRPHRWYCSPECQHVATVGTAAGYHLHQRRHEEACEPCRRAMNHPGSRVKAFAPLANAA